MSKKTTFLLLIAAPVLTIGLAASLFQKNHRLKISEYSGGIPVYKDRCYSDLKQPDVLENLQIVAIPRHFHFPIKLISKGKVTIYRLIAPENNNNFLTGWDKLPADIDVPGKSVNLTEVYAQSFPAGEWVFESGGPIAASPLLIKAENEVKAFYSTNYLFPEGPLAHKTKVLLIVSLILNYGCTLHLLFNKNR